MLPTKMMEQDHIQAVLKDTIVLLCQNGLHFQSQFNIEALVAITVDQSEVLLVSIKETIHANNTEGQLGGYSVIRPYCMHNIAIHTQ